MSKSGFRHDAANYQWDVQSVRREVQYRDDGIKLTYRGRYGLPVPGPSERALREALALIEQGFVGRRVVSRDLVITVHGLEDRDTVSLLEGPGVGQE